MKQFTAIEWFATILDSVLDLSPSEFGKIQEAFEQAKEMEKKQIMDANTAGVNNGLYGYRNAEQYYNKTFKKK